MGKSGFTGTNPVGNLYLHHLINIWWHPPEVVTEMGPMSQKFSALEKEMCARALSSQGGLGKCSPFLIPLSKVVVSETQAN